ncbi:MAG: hypothetical protein HYY35_10475 [Deltaproteobacteria bacterium]|nr:hypothetical protein [Deltaproteobacteria bacterium]
MKRLAILLCLAMGCGRAVTPPVKVSARGEFPAIRTVAVLPVVASATTAGDAAAQAPAAVSRMLSDAAALHSQWSVVAAAQVRDALRAIPAAEDPEEKAGALAAAVQADAGLTAKIAHYRERVGSDYGISEPASVSVQVLATPAGRKQAAWRAEYTFTQEPLAYNLWNLWGVLRGGPRWLTADELARIGIEEAVDRLARGAAAR